MEDDELDELSVDELSVDDEVEAGDPDAFELALAGSVAGFDPSLSVGAGLR